MYCAQHIAICGPQAAKPIGGYLAEHGFRVTPVSSIYRLDRLLAERGADLVILDADNPEADPLAVTRRLSDRNRVAILMLASGSDCLARICGLEAGADDCLAKPAEPREVLARVKAILRRVARAQTTFRSRQAAEGILLGNHRLDLANARLLRHEGGEIALTAMEFALLRTFAEHPDKALSRDELAELSYRRPWSPFDRSLDIRISRLRRKLERDPARPEIIVTVRGIGYRYETAA